MEALPAILGNRTASDIHRQLAAEFGAKGSGHLPCLRVEAVAEYDALLLSTRIVHGGGMVFATHVDGNWQLEDIQPPAPDWGVMEVLYLGVARPRDRGTDLILYGGISGTSGYKSLFRARPNGSGSLQLTAISRSYEYAGFRFLGTDYAVVTQRAEELGPVLETCNACQPLKQTLLKWSGDAYAEVAGRAVSTPYLAANLFLGAIKAGDRGKALKYATSPSIVERWQTSTHQWNSLDSSACRDIDEIEFSNWDLIPEGFRKSLPPDSSTCKVGALQMRRDPGGWVVADISP